MQNVNYSCLVAIICIWFLNKDFILQKVPDSKYFLKSKSNVIAIFGWDMHLCCPDPNYLGVSGTGTSIIDNLPLCLWKNNINWKFEKRPHSQM